MPVWKAAGGVSRCSKDTYDIKSTAYSIHVLVTKCSPNSTHVILRCENIWTQSETPVPRALALYHGSVKRLSVAIA